MKRERERERKGLDEKKNNVPGYKRGNNHCSRVERARKRKSLPAKVAG